jgi:ornithine cyclodeaminase
MPHSFAYLSVPKLIELIQDIGIGEVMAGVADYMTDDFKRWPEFEKIPRLASHHKLGVVELMPVNDDHQFAFKYVNGHPANPAKGLQTVTAIGMLSDMATGYPKLLTEMTIATAVRTAVASAIAGRYLIADGADTMAIIGAGSQAEFQAHAFHEICGISKIVVFDIDVAASEKFIHNMTGSGLDITIATHVKQAVDRADIITTATAAKKKASVLPHDLIRPGQFINAIGGDCPGKTELDVNVLEMADIFVEYEPQTRVEGEIQQLSENHPVTEIWQVITGQANGRKDLDQITLFDSVGFAMEDFSILRYLYDEVRARGADETLDLIADPDDPRDLFSMLR